jgi:hypothetical protein
MRFFVFILFLPSRMGETFFLLHNNKCTSQTRAYRFFVTHFSLSTYLTEFGLKIANFLDIHFFNFFIGINNVN